MAGRHGDDYQTNRSGTQGCWWAREVNVITIADDYDAMVSEGPERGRYEPRLTEIFIADVLGLS